MTSVQFQLYNINCSYGFFRCSFFKYLSINAVFHLCLYGTTLEMKYFRAELVQQTVNESDSKLEVQRYGIKKNT